MKTPPKILTWLLDVFCPLNRPDLKGDFLELYEYRVEQLGRFQANKKFLSDILSVIPLKFIIEEKIKSETPVPMFATNLKIARRNLVKNKVYALINLIGLSVSLTACILITLFVRDELSFDTHFKEKERIFRIAAKYDHGGDSQAILATTSYLVQPMMEGNLAGIDYMSRIDFNSEMITIDGDKQFLETEIIFADSTFFDIFSLPFASGDPSTALDDPGSVVLDKPTAQKYFGTANSIGKSIELKGKQFTVTGVMEEFQPNSHFTCRIIFPMSGVVHWYPDWVLTNITGTNLYTYLKSEVNFNQAEFETRFNKLVASRWGGDNPPEFFLQPLTSIHLKSNLRDEIGINGSETDIYIFSITALVILALACINYVNLSMAGSLQRSKEVGMKKVLGSTTRMQISQFQTESLLVVMMSAILALIFAKLSMPLFNSLSGKMLEFDLFYDLPIGIGLLFVIVMIGLMAGSFPALTLLRMGTLGMLSGNLKFKGGKSYFRNGLIIFQFAISITLIASTVIVMDQISFIRKKNLGIDPEQLVMIPFQTAEISKKYELFKAEMLKNPMILSVSGSNNKVTSSVSSWRNYIADPAKGNVMIPTVTVAHDFFETMGAEILDGRSFSRDYPSDFTKSYIINESAVKFLGLDKPVGAFMFGVAFNGSKWSEINAHIIGVVKDFHFASLHTKMGPVVFSLASEITEPLNWMEVKIANENVRETIESLKQTWVKIAPERPFQFEFMDDELQKNYQAEDQFMKIFFTFSILSILLGGLGLFGLTAFMTKRRTKEIGIRKIIGASTLRLVGILSTDFLKLVMLANLIGWPIAWYLMNNWLRNFAYQTTISLLVFLGTGLAALIIAFMAILYHSLKVSRANPVKALRYE